MKTIKLVVLLSLVSSTVFADPDRVGNGGDGVIVGNHIYVLDLVEAGVEENPFFNEEIQIDTEIQRRLEVVFSKIPNMPVNLLARKFSEIKALDRILGLALLKTAKMYHWRLINEKFTDNQDENRILDYDPQDIVHLAKRNSRTARLQKEFWNDSRLNDSHRVALVTHEIVSALVQDILRTQEITGYLFTEDLASNGREGLMEMIRGSLPLFESPVESVREQNYAIEANPRLVFVPNQGSGWLDPIGYDSLGWDIERGESFSKAEQESSRRARAHKLCQKEALVAKEFPRTARLQSYMFVFQRLRWTLEFSSSDEGNSYVDFVYEPTYDRLYSSKSDDDYPSNVQKNTDKILELYREHRHLFDEFQ